MDICEATEAFTAMDASGHPITIPKRAFLHCVGGGSGFMGRSEAGEMASFIYFGSRWLTIRGGWALRRAEKRFHGWFTFGRRTLVCSTFRSG
jgi:hypothetical protein